MNYRSQKIAEYAQHLDSQIESLEHQLAILSGELTISRSICIQQQREIDALKLQLSDSAAAKPVNTTVQMLSQAYDLVAALPITTQELIRLNNQGAITFNKQVAVIVECLISLRDLFSNGRPSK